MTQQATSGTLLPAAISAPKRLATLGQVRREMTAVYRDMRELVIPPSDGSKLIYALGQIAAVIETEQIENRIGDLEKLTRR